MNEEEKHSKKERSKTIVVDRAKKKMKQLCKKCKKEIKTDLSKSTQSSYYCNACARKMKENEGLSSKIAPNFYLIIIGVERLRKNEVIYLLILVRVRYRVHDWRQDWE